MHAEALSAAIDKWMEDAREDDCAEIDVEERVRTDAGERIVIVTDQNPWESETLLFALLPRRDDKNQLLFLGRGHDEQRGLHFCYLDHQSSFGDAVDVADTHRISMWFGAKFDENELTRLQSLFEDQVRDGIWTHLLSAMRLLGALRDDVPIGERVLETICKINRRMT